ncbi:MAG: DNA polymerase III subunit delta' [Gammaproteobacteria bacterium]|nr:MAG: DNA polymerase III subunit delta' [Gammaproteobacteria bacterium]
MTGGYPWQDRQWSQLMARVESHSLPHAMLFSGINGLGKTEFATRFIHALLCTNQQDNGNPCGACKGCTLLAANTHPDLVQIVPEEAGKAIKVDQIRDAQGFVGLTSQYQGYRILLVNPADAMNINAANSLLKTLEEPPANAIIILVTDYPGRLLPTVRSRCQQLLFYPPDRALGVQWLKGHLAEATAAEVTTLLELAAGAPLQALAMSRNDTLSAQEHMLSGLGQLLSQQADPVKIASTWYKNEPVRTLLWFSSLIRDMIRLKSVPGNGDVASSAAEFLEKPHSLQKSREFAQHIEIKQLYSYLDALAEAGRLLRGQVNIQLLMEELLIRWSRYGKSR